MNRLIVYIFFLLVAFISCTQEFSPTKNNSAITLIPDLGEFRLKVFTQLSNGNILMAGHYKIINSDGMVLGTDTSVFYLIDPDTRNVRKIDALKGRYGYLYGACEMKDGSLAIHYEGFDKSYSCLVRLNKDYEVIDSFFTISYQLFDVVSENMVDAIYPLADGGIMINEVFSIIKLNANLDHMWVANSAINILFSIESQDGSICAVGGQADGELGFEKYSSDGVLINSIEEKREKNAAYWDVLESGGKFYANGYLGAGKQDIDGFITVFNQDGNILKHKLFSTKNDDFGRKLIPTADGGFVFLMTRIVENSTRSIKVLKLDSDLNTLWEKEVLKPGKANAAPIGKVLKDGRIAIGCFGEASSNTFNGMDASVIFLDKNGNF